MKSLSNLAMAGSCRNMPKYSLAMLTSGVKHELSLQSLTATELVSTLNLFAVYNKSGGRCVRYRSKTRTRETGVKVPKCILSVAKGVLNLRQ